MVDFVWIQQYEVRFAIRSYMEYEWDILVITRIWGSAKDKG